MVLYSIYGLRIASDFPLNTWLADSDEPDVAVRQLSQALPDLEAGGDGLFFHISPERICLHWADIGTFSIHARGDIAALPAPGASLAVFQRTLTGSVLAIAAFQRGRFMLHASAVTMDGGAVVFAGDCGWGKSTLAARLHALGHSLIADDVVAIAVGDSAHRVFPGIQEFKLWPDSIEALGGRREDYPRFFPGGEKRLQPVAHGRQNLPVALRAIYILDIGEKDGMDPLGAAQAAVELVGHAYAVQLLHAVQPLVFFRQATALARSVPVRRLRRTDSFGNFERFLGLIRQDLRHHP